MPTGGFFWQSQSAAASANVGSAGARSAAGNGGVLASMLRTNAMRSVTALASLSSTFICPAVPARQCACAAGRKFGPVPMPNASSSVAAAPLWKYGALRRRRATTGR